MQFVASIINAKMGSFVTFTHFNYSTDQHEIFHTLCQGYKEEHWHLVGAQGHLLLVYQVLAEYQIFIRATAT